MPVADVSSADLTAADVVCVGGGLGGLAVAAAATAAGLDTLVLEAADTLGGCGSYSGGLVWAPGASPDSPDDAERYLAHIQGERSSDGHLRRALLAALAEALPAFEKLGVTLDVVAGNPDVYHPAAPGSVASGRMFETAIAGAELGALRDRLTPSPHYRIGLTHAELHGGSLGADEVEALFASRQAEDHLTMGPGLAGAFLRAAQEARLVTGARVTGLLRDTDTDTDTDTGIDDGTDTDGAVTGVRLADGRTITARRGVVLATGGYGWAADAKEIDALPDLAEAGPPTLRGDHLQLAEQAGAAVVRGCGPQFALGAQVQPGDVHPGTQDALVSQLFDVTGLPHTVVVNRAGQRFGDESYYVGINVALAAWDPARHAWPNVPCWLIVDEQFRHTYPLATIPAGEPYPSTFTSAPDLPTLATALGIDPDGLVASIERFNEHAARGEDPDHDRGSKPFVRRRYGDPTHLPNACLGPVTTPPFHALPLRLLGTGLATYGLSVDAGARALRRGGDAVPGLFAVGTAAATTEVRGGYITGYANARTLALAHLAVRTITSGSTPSKGST